MNMVNVLLLALLVGVMIFDSIMQSGLREKLRRADIEVMRMQAERNRMEAELHSVLRREENKRYHQCKVRDERIKELEARYQTLADISNRALATKSGK